MLPQPHLIGGTTSAQIHFHLMHVLCTWRPTAYIDEYFAAPTPPPPPRPQRPSIKRPKSSALHNLVNFPLAKSRALTTPEPCLTKYCPASLCRAGGLRSGKNRSHRQCSCTRYIHLFGPEISNRGTKLCLSTNSNSGQAQDVQCMC